MVFQGAIMAKEILKKEGTESKSSDYTPKKKITRGGSWDNLSEKEAFSNPNGKSGADAGYTGTFGGGDVYATAIREGKAHASAFTMPGKSTNVDAATDAKRAKRLQANPEKVRTLSLEDGKGVAPKLAANDDGNPKKRTKNVSGGPEQD
jgi:hypothetical protein